MSHLTFVRFSDKKFLDKHITTLGVESVSSTYRPPDGPPMPIFIWDTAGQERFRTITKNFYRNANGVILVFDVTNKATFVNVKTWLQSLSEHAKEDIVKTLVGNKIDCSIEER